MPKEIEFDRKDEIQFAKAMMDMNPGQVEELLVNCDREDLLESGRIINDFSWKNDSLQGNCNFIMGEILCADNLPYIWEAGNIEYTIRKSAPNLYDRVESFLSDDDDETVEEIPIPNLQSSSQKVFAALREAEKAIQAGSPENCVDRFHTAFHGHLKEMCDEQGLNCNSKDPRVDELFKCLLENYKQKNNLTNDDNAYKLLRSFSQFFVQFNNVRNHSTLSHPGGKLLDSADALLFVNFSKTILTYIIEKFK
ncbi:abortive infection family protein [Providencia sp. PROV255]|uniref:abortive infection family protein n=1 Tax=Providencia sp. PROV255 TaxID=2949943 RepID=UPI00234BEADC|nr:abortive infection family protein [Providencia sp. PROV255]